MMLNFAFILFRRIFLTAPETRLQLFSTNLVALSYKGDLKKLAPGLLSQIPTWGAPLK